MHIQKIQKEIVDEFAMFEDWMQRYEYMIDLGKSLPLIDAEYKTDDKYSLDKTGPPRTLKQQIQLGTQYGE